MKGQHVKLITRQIGFGEDDPAEVVTAVMIGDQRLELPMGSDLTIEYRGAGDSIALVHVVLIAATVRYEEEPPPVPPDAEVHIYDPEIDGSFTGVETVKGLPVGDGRVVDGTGHSWCCPLDDPCVSHKLRFSPEA